MKTRAVSGLKTVTVSLTGYEAMALANTLRSIRHAVPENYWRDEIEELLRQLTKAHGKRTDTDVVDIDEDDDEEGEE